MTTSFFKGTEFFEKSGDITQGLSIWFFNLALDNTGIFTITSILYFIPFLWIKAETKANELGEYYTFCFGVRKLNSMGLTEI